MIFPFGAGRRDVVGGRGTVLPVLGLGRAELDEAVMHWGIDCFLSSSIGGRAVLARGSLICEAKLMAGVDMARDLRVMVGTTSRLPGEAAGPADSLVRADRTEGAGLVSRLEAASASPPNVRISDETVGAERAVGPTPGCGSPASRGRGNTAVWHDFAGDLRSAGPVLAIEDDRIIPRKAVTGGMGNAEEVAVKVEPERDFGAVLAFSLAIVRVPGVTVVLRTAVGGNLVSCCVTVFRCPKLIEGVFVMLDARE